MLSPATLAAFSVSLKWSALTATGLPAAAAISTANFARVTSPHCYRDTGTSQQPEWWYLRCGIKLRPDHQMTPRHILRAEAEIRGRLWTERHVGRGGISPYQETPGARSLCQTSGGSAKCHLRCRAAEDQCAAAVIGTELVWPRGIRHGIG